MGASTGCARGRNDDKSRRPDLIKSGSAGSSNCAESGVSSTDQHGSSVLDGVQDDGLADYAHSSEAKEVGPKDA